MGVMSTNPLAVKALPSALLVFNMLEWLGVVLFLFSQKNKVNKMIFLLMYTHIKVDVEIFS